VPRAIDILLVEPDPVHHLLIREGISKVSPGCHVERVEEFDHAKPLIQADSPDAEATRRLNPSLIIIELLDPKKPEGAEFMQWLRQHPRTRHLPVIVLGVEGDAYSVTKAYELGGSSYLVKPKDQESFIQMIAEAAKYWTRLNHPPE